jgi:hypothetical protein
MPPTAVEGAKRFFNLSAPQRSVIPVTHAVDFYEVIIFTASQTKRRLSTCGDFRQQQLMLRSLKSRIIGTHPAPAGAVMPGLSFCALVPTATFDGDPASLNAHESARTASYTIEETIK